MDFYILYKFALDSLEKNNMNIWRENSLYLLNT